MDRGNGLLVGASLTVIGILAFFIFWAFFVYKVPAGYVGIKVNLLGDSSGVQVEELKVGRHIIGINEELYLFPTFTQNTTWTGEDRFTFQTKEGMKVSGDVGLTYSIDPEYAPVLFQKYRSGIDEITNKFLRNIIRDAFNAKASTINVESAYGEGKATMLADIEEKVRKQVKDIGINVERIYYASDLVLPDSVTQSLNAKIQATQMAEQRKNEVQQSIAEADKLRAQAQGEADARAIKAEADAKAILMKAEAEAKSIRLRAEAVKESKEVIILNAIEQWDGKLPTFYGGETPSFIVQ